MRFILRIIVLAVVLACAAIPLARSQYPPAPSRDEACPSVPAVAQTYRTFSAQLPLLERTSFTGFQLPARHFGHTFSQRGKLNDLVQAFWREGYDYIGSREGYLLFYRRPVSWNQITAVPGVVAPNGQRLPPPILPTDLDPQWPAPSILVQTAPFLGAIVLPQNIVAYPCFP